MKFLKNANSWSLFSNESLDIRTELPGKNYTIRFNELAGQYFLEETEPFNIPSKIYGKTQQYCDRIIRTFNKSGRDAQVGALLEGTKGSGKTLLAKLVAVRSGLPTIIVNSPFTGEKFMRTLQEIDQPAVIIFDEFEKLYDSDQQEQILTMFDGVYSLQNKIIIVTCNDRFAVREFFHNRPSRLRYSIHYSGLDESFIREYCEDTLYDKGYIESIVSYSMTCADFNFDMLQVLVDELNYYGGKFEDIVEILNVKSFSNTADIWDVEITVPKEHAKEIVLTQKTFKGDPVRYLSSFGNIEISYSVKYEDDEVDYFEFNLNPADIKKLDRSSEVIVFGTKHENVSIGLTMKKRVNSILV